MLLNDLPWVSPPPGSQPFNKQGVIAAPVVNVETAVLSWRVPDGMHGVIHYASHNFIGGGFLQGSGQIVWRLKVNRKHVNDYGQMLTELGAIDTPVPIPAGIVVRAGHTVEYLVLITDPSLTPGGTATFVGCRLMGWFWPKHYDVDQFISGGQG